ncbi:unnamed protein product [Nesidiocoris tenuis]|uniref:Fanconi-associated nuclease n=1 Tax=Nesidiocoris tenuis TaxID=355587 RepID=A0A6H5HRD2_9HEMI|nr:unnamed protein product [Nesidiocoris tenuis]
MGCASSAPLVQQGLDAAKKAMSREKDQMESKSKDIAESTAGAANSMMDSVVHAKDEAVEKLQGSDNDDSYFHGSRRRSKKSPAKRARISDVGSESTIGDIFNNISSLPTSTPNQASTATRSRKPTSNYKSFNNLTNDSLSNSNRPGSNALAQNAKQLETGKSWGFSPSKSDESLGRLKSLVEGAMVSSSDEEIELSGVKTRARKTANPKSDSFQNRMANAMLELDNSENEADESDSTDSIIEASTQPSIYSAKTILDLKESNGNQKDIYDQTTQLLVTEEDRNLPDQIDIVDCDTDPPSPIEENEDISSEEVIDLFPTTNPNRTNCELRPVKSEFPDCRANDQNSVEIVNLVDSCSIVDLCDSSIEVSCSSKIPIEPLPKAGPSKPTKTFSPSKKRLMDVVLAECETFSPYPLTVDPLNSFVGQYFKLDSDAKDVFDQLLIPSLDNDVRWMRCTDESIADQLVDNDLFMFLDHQDDFFSRLAILLNASELSMLFSRLDPHPGFNSEAMRTHLLQDISSCILPKCKNGFVEKAATTWFAKRFIKMRPKASYSAKMALDILALPLNLYEKAVKHGDMARYFETLLAEVDSGRKRLLELVPVNPSSLISTEAEFRTFAESFALKFNNCFPKHQRPQLPGMQSLSELCAAFAIVFYSHSYQVNENPIFAFQVSNLVRALDEKIVLLHTDDDEVLKAKFLCLDLLLQQEVTQFATKGLWAKRKMLYLGKIFGVQCNAQQLEDVLSQNVSPLEMQVRTNFVAQILSSKKKGLTAAERREIRATLKDPSFKKTVLKIKWPTGDQRKANLVVSPYEEYFRKNYPNHVPNPGPLLMNAIFLAFWPVIYHQLDDVFFTNFQNSPIDWGGEKFYERRQGFFSVRVAGFAEKGIDSLISSIEDCIRRFSGSHCIVDWPLVDGKMREMRSLLKVLGLDKFLLIAKYVLQKASEREIGFPELAMWDSRMKLELVGLKNPSDPLYYHQFVWLEKLTEFGISAQECQVAWMR